MLRFEKHIVKGLYQNIALSQSCISLYQKNAFLFVNRRKGLTKEERAVHVTAEFLEREDKKEEAQERKRLKRKGIDPDEERPVTPAKQFARQLLNKMRADPINFFSDNNIMFDEKTGLMGRKDTIGNVEKFVQSEEWKSIEAEEKEQEKKEQELLEKKKLQKESRAKKENLEEDDSKGLFEEWENDPSKEKLGQREEGGGRKVKRQQKMILEKPKAQRDEFKNIFRQFSQEPLEQIESEKQSSNNQEEDISFEAEENKQNRNNKVSQRGNKQSEDDEFRITNKDLFDETERVGERSNRNKPAKRFEENDFIENEDSFYENVAEHRKNPETSERKLKGNNKESKKLKQDPFQSILDQFSAEPIGDLKAKKSSKKSEVIEEEEEDFFLEDMDKFDQPISSKSHSKAYNKDRGVKSEQESPKKNNLQQFYSELSEDKIKKIQKRIELDENEMARSESQDDYFSQSQRQRSTGIADYETFKKNLEKRKSLERFYHFLRKFDSDNLIKILSFPNLIDKNPTEQIPKFLILLNYIRKNKLLQNYNREDIHGVLGKIISHIDQLRYTEVSTLAVLLDKMRIDRADYFRELEKRVIEDAEKFSIRTISNIIFSFGRISTKQSVMEDFSELFAKMENIIALKVKNMNPKDISQIMVGYSKSQNFSPELLYVLEQECIEKYDMMQCQELSVIAHTFMKNDHFSGDFFDKLKVSVLRDGGKFRMMELALVMEAFEKFRVINQEVLRELERQFIRRADQSNVQDLAVFFKVLTRPDYKMGEKTISKMTEISNLLFNNIDANCLFKMFNNFAEKFEKGTIKRDMAELMIRRFKVLIRTNAIRGIHFTEIKAELFKVKDENIIRRSKKALQEEFAKKDTRKNDKKQNPPQDF